MVVILYRNAIVGAGSRYELMHSNVLFSFLRPRCSCRQKSFQETYCGFACTARCDSHVFKLYPPSIHALISHHAARTAIDVFCQPLPRSLIVTNRHRHIRSSRPGLVAEALQGYFSAHHVAPVFLSHCSLLEFPNDNHSSCPSVVRLHRYRFHHSKNVERLYRSPFPSRSRRLL